MLTEKTALIVVNDQMLGEALRVMLESLGFETTYCESGAAALELVKGKCFAFILTDYLMPELDGVEITRALRPLCPDAFIIGLSAENKRKEFAEAGANVFFSKPLSIPVLASLIEKIDIITQRTK